MEYHLPLKYVGIVVGLLLLGSHAYAYWQAGPTQRWLSTLPRSRVLGIVLMTIVLAWTFVLSMYMDWGEFYNMQHWVLLMLPVAYGLTLYFVDEFLAARALGILLLLAAAPLLESAFLQPVASRLFLVVLAYGWIGMGMLWVGLPYLLRDQIGWVTKSVARWRIAAGAGVAYGVIVLVCAIAWYPDTLL